MRSFRRLFRPGRALAGLLLLTALAAGEAADARHHLSDPGCAADSRAPGRDDDCACAALHSATPAGLAPAAFAPVEQERGHAPGAVPAAPHRHGEPEAAPRAPPRS